MDPAGTQGDVDAVKEALKGEDDDAVKSAYDKLVENQQKIGEATGDRKMQGEGALQEAKGRGQKVLGDAKDLARDAVDKATGAAGRKP